MLSTKPLGIMQACLDVVAALRPASAKQFRHKPIGSFQLIQTKIHAICLIVALSDVRRCLRFMPSPNPATPARPRHGRSQAPSLRLKRGEDLARSHQTLGGARL